MTDHRVPITVPAWVLSDLVMVANLSPLYSRAAEAIDQAAKALDAAKVPVRVGAQGPPSAPEAEFECAHSPPVPRCPACASKNPGGAR